jgi:hypothetical protein
MRNTAPLILSALLAGCAAFGSPAAPATNSASSEAPALVLGVYDPRAIALVHYRSSAHLERVAAAVKEHERAKAAGDAAAAQRIEQEMEALQERAHRQTFGGEAAPEILALIADQLPELAARAGVDAIVARPDLAWLRSDAHTVDVSLILAEAFHPDADTLRMLPDLLRRAPTPAGDLGRHRD